MLIDRFARKIDYLRLSVTELCNIRCSYCMPLEGVVRACHEEILSFEEIIRLARILAGLGIRRIRLTGGEPLVRKGLPELVRELKAIPQIEEVLLTTNGILLAPLAKELRKAGLKKANIHLDSLDPEIFRKITRWGNLGDVLKGIQEARRVGLSPIKINMVVQKGINDGEVEKLLEFTARNELVLRLIELMPIGPARQLAPGLFVPLEEVKKRLRQRFTLIPSTERVGSGPAVYYKVGELGTLVGFISPVSEPFCGSCNRVRISSDGRFQDCLAYDGSFSLRDFLRNENFTDEGIANEVVSLLQGKREGHDGFCQSDGERTPCMFGIGG
ncbi:MAG: GTP 3',8-cyclase MoaA [Deltaproteobacteria bacterium]|nr:GTP 3',8-cyclase MoaA [Deltaproteobacteria bacterium]